MAAVFVFLFNNVASEACVHVAGPFSAEDMAQWFSAGYFTMTLLVKRGCDQQFQPLGKSLQCFWTIAFYIGSGCSGVVTNVIVAIWYVGGISKQSLLSVLAR